jgi:hypothetical protein
LISRSDPMALHPTRIDELESPLDSSGLQRQLAPR